MAALIEPYLRLTEARSSAPVAQIAAPLERQANAAGERPLGNVIADAYLFAMSGDVYAERAAEIAFVNPGGIRTRLGPGPEVNYGQLYRTHPFGNTLMTLELSGAQLYRLLEQQWEAPQPKEGRILSVSAGFSYRWDARQPAGAPAGKGRRIVPGSLTLKGQQVAPERLYRVAVNSYLASGGDNFSILAQARQIQESELDLDALVAYFRAQGIVAVPALDRIQRLD